MRRSVWTIAGLLFVLGAPPAGAQLNEDLRAARPGPPQHLGILTQRFLPGYEALSPPRDAALAATEATTFSQQVTAGACYAVAAVNTRGVDVDVRIRVAGEIVAQDVKQDSYPIARWCPASSTTAQIEIRAFAEAAEVTYGVYISRNDRDAAAGPLDELSNRLSNAIARSAPRWEPVGAQWRTTYAQAGVHDMTFDAEAGRCYAVVAVGQAPVEDIDLLLLDEAEYARNRDVALDATPLVAYCPPSDETLTVRVALRVGRGVVAAQLLQHER